MNYSFKLELKNCKSLNKLRKYIFANKIDVVFFGETHGILDELKIQEKIISIIKPTCYLYELLEEEKLVNKKDFHKFLARKDFERFSVISKVKELKPTVLLAFKFNLPIIGCDIKNMCRKSTDFLREVDFKEEEIIMLKREKKQNSVIKKSLKIYNRPIFVSLGVFHLRKDSFTFNNIKKFIKIIPLINGKNLEELTNFNIQDIKEVVYVLTENEKIEN